MTPSQSRAAAKKSDSYALVDIAGDCQQHGSMTLWGLNAGLSGFQTKSAGDRS
jgi:hypothetical protein